MAIGLIILGLINLAGIYRILSLLAHNASESPQNSREGSPLVLRRQPTKRKPKALDDSAAFNAEKEAISRDERPIS